MKTTQCLETGCEIDLRRRSPERGVEVVTFLCSRCGEVVTDDRILALLRRDERQLSQRRSLARRKKGKR